VKLKDPHDIQDWKNKHGSGAVFDQYFLNLKNNAKKLSDFPMACHVHIITDKSVWKVFDFDQNIIVEEATKQVARKMHIPEER
jgi:hypothetical protein